MKMCKSLRQYWAGDSSSQTKFDNFDVTYFPNRTYRGRVANNEMNNEQ